MDELGNDELLQWVLARREMPTGTFKGYEQMLKEFAAKPEAQKVIRKFLSLKPSQQQEVLSSLSPKDSLLLRRMLGPEWTRQEDCMTEHAGREMWPDILAYAKANP